VKYHRFKFIMSSFPLIYITRSIFKPEMVTIDARIKSFENWKSNSNQSPLLLAESGFFFTGTSDRVYCFYCGIGLHEWLSEDNPWMEHAISSPTCPFLLLNKGKTTPRVMEDCKNERLIVSRAKETIVSF